MVLHRVFLAAAVTLGGLASASAEYKTIDRKEIVGWAVSTIKDTEAADRTWCLFRSPAVGNYVFEGTIGVSSNEQDAIKGAVNLENGTWQLGPNSAGRASVKIVDEARTLAFHRISSTQLQSDLKDNEESEFVWLFTALAGEPVVVTLPNGEGFTVPGNGGEVFPAFLACLGLKDNDQPSESSKAAPTRRPDSSLGQAGNLLNQAGRMMLRDHSKKP